MLELLQADVGLLEVLVAAVQFLQGGGEVPGLDLLLGAGRLYLGEPGVDRPGQQAQFVLAADRPGWSLSLARSDLPHLGGDPGEPAEQRALQQLVEHEPEQDDQSGEGEGEIADAGRALGVDGPGHAHLQDEGRLPEDVTKQP